MRILIDTNIFIPMEDSAIQLDTKLAELHRLASTEHQILVHPSSKDDISRDKNDARRSSMLQRLNKYVELESPPQFLENEEEQLLGSPKKDNDRVDNLILLALHKNCVHWLVTQDEGIHKKAKTIGAYERVLSVDQAIRALLKTKEGQHRLYPNIENVLCHTLNLNHKFFQSLRADYDGFDAWFSEKCSKTGRQAWACISGDEIHALAIYKQESSPIVTNDNRGLPGDVLKLCTFKVVKRGFKIGELLLKQAFNYASDNNLQFVYATVAPGQHEMLEDLFSEFGFSEYGTDSQGRDIVYVKEFPSILPITDDPPLDYTVKYYPATKLDGNKAFLIPIKPRYHNILFPEQRIQSDMFSDVGNSAGNAIKQAYLCKSPTKSVKPGDMIFFTVLKMTWL